MEAVTHPPSPEEALITDGLGVRWLLTRYLKRSRSAPRPTGIAFADYATEPGGGEWIALVPEAGNGLPRLERVR